MSTAVSYWGIQQSIGAVVQAGISASIPVVLEDEIAWADQWVGVYLIGRSATERLQRLTQGFQADFEINYEIEVRIYGMALDQTIAVRDELLADIELVLQNNKTIAGAVETSWITGGDHVTARDAKPGKFLAAATINLVCAQTAIYAVPSGETGYRITPELFRRVTPEGLNRVIP